VEGIVEGGADDAVVAALLQAASASTTTTGKMCLITPDNPVSLAPSSPGADRRRRAAVRARRPLAFEAIADAAAHGDAAFLLPAWRACTTQALPQPGGNAPASADLLLPRDRSAPAPPAQPPSSPGRGQEIIPGRAARSAVARPAAVLFASRPGRAAVTAARKLQVDGLPGSSVPCETRSTCDDGSNGRLTSWRDQCG